LLKQKQDVWYRLRTPGTLLEPKINREVNTLKPEHPNFIFTTPLPFSRGEGLGLPQLNFKF
ncbi:hypothetical protein COU14_00990, partial [Candidatus Kaiserbacteria bacterium CG10_big_fil_rev_8_21_14_0_10_44_10]